MARASLTPLGLMNLGADPALPDKGQMYYNSTLDKIRYYNGTAWVSVADAGNYVTTDTVQTITALKTLTSATNSDLLKLGNRGTIVARSNGANGYAFMSDGAFYDGTNWRYADGTGKASIWGSYNGDFVVSTAPGGTAGSIMTYTDRLSVTASGVTATGALISTGHIQANGLTGAAIATRWVGANGLGPPLTGTFAIGDWIIAQDGIWLCQQAGTPGQWLRLQEGTWSNYEALKNWRRALSMTASEPADVLTIGDSIGEGFFATSEGKRWSSIFIEEMQARYNPLGMHGTGGYIPATHSGNATGTGWTYTGTTSDNYTFGLGRRARQLTVAGSTASITFFGDRFWLPITKGPTAGSLSIAIDGGAPVTVAAYNAVNVIQTMWDSGPLTRGNHTVVVTAVTDGGGRSLVVVDGIMPFDGDGAAPGSNVDTGAGVRYWDGSHAGYMASDFAGPAATSQGYWALMLPTINPDLIMIEVGGNEINQGKSSTQAATDLDNLITFIKAQYGTATPSICIVSYPGWSNFTDAAWLSFVFDQRKIAVKHGCAFVDWRSRIPDAQGVNDGFWADQIHPSDGANYAFARLAIEDLAMGIDSTKYVSADLTQTITGAKTFSVAPVVPDGSFTTSKITGLGPAFWSYRNRNALSKFHEALANAAAAPVDMYFFGDSITEGYYASNFDQRWASIVRDRLQRLYNPASIPGGAGMVNPHVGGMAGGAADPWVYSGTVSVTAPGVDPNSWGLGQRYAILNGADDSATLTFFGDQVVIYYTQGSGAGNMNISIDGGAATVVNTNNATLKSGVAWISPPLTRGTHTVTITWGSALVILDGAFVLDGDISAGVRLWDAAHSGTSAANAAAATRWTDYTAGTTPGPEMAFICFGANDINAGVTAAQFGVDMTALITKLRLAGPGATTSIGIIMLPKRGAVTDAAWQAYVDSAEAVALATGSAFFDLSKVIPAAPSTGSSTLYFDTVHPNSAGHMAIADALMEQLLPAARSSRDPDILSVKQINLDGMTQSLIKMPGATNIIHNVGNGTALAYNMVPTGDYTTASVIADGTTLLRLMGDRIQMYSGASVAAGAANGLNKMLLEALDGTIRIGGMTGSVQQARWVGSTTTGAPTTGDHVVGDWVVARDGKVWICTVAGTPGTWVDAGSGGAGAVSSVNTRTGAVTGLAEDNAVVHLTGSETISGTKTFSAGPILSNGMTWASQFFNNTTAASAGTPTTVGSGSILIRTAYWDGAASQLEDGTFTGGRDSTTPNDSWYGSTTRMLKGTAFKPVGFTGATQQSRYVGATTSGGPVTGTFVVGDWVVARDAKVWVCTTAGSPGTWTDVSAAAPAPSNMVTTDTTQTISGLKTFSADLTATSIVNASSQLKTAVRIGHMGGIVAPLNLGLILTSNVTTTNGASSFTSIAAGGSVGIQLTNTSVNFLTGPSVAAGAATNFDVTLASMDATGITGYVGGITAATFLKPGGLTGAVQVSRYVGATTSGAPTTGTFQIGDYVVARNGKLWICTVAGSPGTWVDAGGGGGTPVVTTVTATGTLTGTSGVWLVNSASATTQTLPAAAANAALTIKNIGAGVVTVARAGGSLIDDATTYTLTQYASLDVVSDGTNWYVV